MKIRISEYDSVIREDLELHPNDLNLISRIEIKELKRGIEISTSNYIGSIKLENFEVIVEPKIPLKNILGLIAYALEFDNIEITKSETDFQIGDYLIDVLIDTFVKQCEKLEKQGLLKSYITYSDDVSFLRGKLLIKQQINHMVRKRPYFACEFDELEYDNLENRILLYCLKLCLQITESPKLRKKITTLIKQFSTEVNYTKITLDDFEQIQYTRLNHHYESLHRLAKLIITSTGMSKFAKQDTANSFFVDMNVIFENFVTRLFKEYHTLNVESQKSKHAWNTSEKKLNIRTDILLDSKIVIDVKYKNELSKNDLYQIGFYIHEYKQNKGYAILPAHHAKEQDITSNIQKITISARILDVEKTLELIYENKEKELREMLQNIVPVQ